ncbi:YkgJ family cysteine cluster protein [Lachnobacterium bovis]|uniref:Uncharacterized protein n=1 Tax=Lachnobacterium bovis TaxID=140626 RepID=A0A1H9T931_9FIRM|nr:YkgJ family cysteine cluster protein [Lachnobacterium bovis]SER93646.1 hypothetical protein SAMN02910429_01523 [Lachnobacterium bovis]
MNSYNNIDINRLYSSKEMARLVCKECEGCGQCCEQMGDTVKIDPYDFFVLSFYLNQSFDELFDKKIQVHREENGLILPHIKQDNQNKCVFMDNDRRCSIHQYRPGICRLFPLGRNYENGTFKYFVVDGACNKGNRSKIRISQWLGIDNINQYERFVSDWHYFVKEIAIIYNYALTNGSKSDLDLYLLKVFYRMPYNVSDINGFYEEFYKRMNHVNDSLEPIKKMAPINDLIDECYK